MHIEIPLGQWESFCRHFSGQHRAWLVTFGELPSKLAADDEPLQQPWARLLARQLALREVRATVEPSSRERVLEIVAGDSEQRVCHRVAAPCRLVLEQTASGIHRGLRIESEGGRTTLLRFRAVVAPESVDGAAP